MGREAQISDSAIILAVMENGDFGTYNPQKLIPGIPKNAVRRVSSKMLCVDKLRIRGGFALNHAPNYSEWMTTNYGSNEEPPQFPLGSKCENCFYLFECPMLEKKRKAAKKRKKLIVR